MKNVMHEKHRFIARFRVYRSTHDERFITPV